MGDHVPPPELSARAALRALLQTCREWRHLHDAYAAAAEHSTQQGYYLPPLATLYTSRQRQQVEQGIRPDAGLTQWQVSILIGLSPETYKTHEHGTKDIPEKTLPVLAGVLGMTGDQIIMLYRLRFSRDPPPTLAEPDVTLVTPQWRDWIAEAPWPAYISDHSWTRVVENELFYDWFPWVAPDGPTPERNVMLMIAMRESRRRMEEWLLRWATPLWQRVLIAKQMYPGNRRLADLVAEITADPSLRPLWGRRHRHLLPLDSDVRYFQHRTRGRVPVSLHVVTPDSLALFGYRVVTLRVHNVDTPPDRYPEGPVPPR